MRGLERRLAERGIRIEVSDKAFDLLGNVGFDPVYGARPLKRAIQQQLENPLASKILAGEFGNGDTARVDAEGGNLVFEKAGFPGPGAGPLRASSTLNVIPSAAREISSSR